MIDRHRLVGVFGDRLIADRLPSLEIDRIPEDSLHDLAGGESDVAAGTQLGDLRSQSVGIVGRCGLNGQRRLLDVSREHGCRKMRCHGLVHRSHRLAVEVIHSDAASNHVEQRRCEVHQSTRRVDPCAAANVRSSDKHAGSHRIGQRVAVHRSGRGIVAEIPTGPRGDDQIRSGIGFLGSDVALPEHVP